MFGWHHQLNEREFEQAPGVGNGQGSLAHEGAGIGNMSDLTGTLLASAQLLPFHQKSSGLGWFLRLSD